MHLVSHMANQQTSFDLVFAALSDSTRRAIVVRLSKESASVSELSKPFTMAMPTLLQHLRVLETSGLIETEKVGRVRTCSLRPEVMARTEQWLAMQRAVWEQRLDRMDSYVKELHARETKNAKQRRKGR